MSFFNLSDGKQVESTTEFDIGGGDFDPMPAGTQLVSMIEEAKWVNKEDFNTKIPEDMIELRWLVLEGEYKSRKQFQKIRLKHEDSKKRDKAMKMLVAIDANCGGNLVAAGKEPTDMDLAQHLLMTPMVIMVQTVTEKNENGIEVPKANWVNKVSSLANGKPDPGPIATASDFNDDVDF